MSDDKIDVFTVKECTLTAAGESMPVSSFSLTLKHNGVPMLRADVDPMHTTGEKDGAKTADPVSVASLVQRYNKLQKAINGGDAARTASFKFEMEVSEPLKGARKQKLDLKGWLLVGAGFSSNAAGGMTLNVEIRHPVHKLYETSANFYGVKAEETLPIDEVLGWGDVLDGIKKGMDKYLEYVKNGTVEVVNDAEFQLMQDDYQKARTALDDHLEWKGPGTWPVAPFLNFDKEIKYGMWQYVNSTGSSSYWDWISGSICNEWHTSIIPTFWKEKLEMGPTRPWQKFNLKLLDISVMDFELPPTDPAPLKGVYTFFDVPEMSFCTTFNSKEGMQFSLANAAIWSEKVHNSAFFPFQAPAWFNSIFARQSGEFSGMTEPGAMAGDGRLVLPIGSSMGQGDMGTTDYPTQEKLIDGMKAFCKQQFTEFYRMNMEISVRTKLMIQDAESQWEEQYVTAGMTARMETDGTFQPGGGGGQPLLDFFVTEVTHMVDCQRVTAASVFRGSWVRESDGGPANIESIPNGAAPNYLYE